MADFYSRGTIGVNNQIFPSPMGSLFAPNAGLGPILRGGGDSQALPTIPTQGGAGISTATGYRQPGSGVTTKQWFLLGGMFIVGALVLRYVHWRG